MILIASRRPSESDSLINNLFFYQFIFKFRGTCQGQRPVMAEAKITKRAYTRCPRSGEELGKEVKLKTGTGGTEYSKSVAFPYIIGNRRRSCRTVTLCHCPILEGPTAFRMWSATGFNPKTAMGSHSNLRNRVRFQMKMAWNMLSSSKSFSTRHRGLPVSHIVRLSFKIRIVSH